MSVEEKEKEKNLSACESVIMKVIWDAGGVITLLDILDILKKDYGKNYSRNTVATFLQRMEDKGYVASLRKGKNSYIRALKDKDEYAYQQLQYDKKMWFAGKASNLMCALVKQNDISKEEIAEIRSMLDELDGVDR